MVTRRKVSVGAKKYKESAKRIRELRAALGDLQGAFAKRLAVTQPMVSAWEGAKDGPSSAFFLQLGSLASFPENLWFWEQAGLSREVMMELARNLLPERAVPLVDGEVYRIPRFRETLQGRESAGPPLALPAECLPHPAQTICLVMDKKATGVVSCPRGIFILDTFVEGAEDLSNLWERVVMLQYPGTPYLLQGVYAGRLWLRDDWQISRHRDGARTSGWLVPLGEGTEPERVEYPYLGEYLEPECMKGISSDDAKARAEKMAEVRGRALSKFRTDKGIRILGKAIGRLSGHLEMEQAKGEEQEAKG
jgi:transcriptional regulator with XRE-family HTH domain